MMWAYKKIKSQSVSANQQIVRWYFILDETDIVALIDKNQFKTNITIGKMLKIVRDLIDSCKLSAAIAKQFKVEQAIVDIM